MAWIEQYRRADGGLTARVIWRPGGARDATRLWETSAPDLQPVLEGLLAKNPADRLTAERAKLALLDLQHEHQSRTGWPDGKDEERREPYKERRLELA
jgi:hypothetical protein